MKKLILFALVSILFFSCQKAILGDDESNTVENNFELLWGDFDKHYGLFSARGWDWDGIYAQYRPQVTPQTSEAELWQIFKAMISSLDDSHTFIFNPKENEFFASGSENEVQVEAESDPDLVFNNYLENANDIPNPPDDAPYFYGKIKQKNIGYMFLASMDFDANQIDFLLSEIGQYDALIIDIRDNTGGDDLVSAAVAGRFADEERFIYTGQERNGPNHDDFAEKKDFFTKKMGTEHFDKPVIILTDQETVSAAEIFLFHMKSFPNVTQIGDTTAGDFSDTSTRRFLPNGWQYQYSIFMYLLPDGSSLDGIGHIPDVYVRNTIADITNEQDKMLERSVQYLLDEYGIE